MIKLKLALAATLILALSPAISADPVSADIRINAHVPVSCSASLDLSVISVSEGQFRIGQMSRFCNTSHMVTINTVSGINGTIHMEGQSASTLSGQAVVNPFSNAKRGNADIFLSGVTRAQADQIVRSFSVSLAPVGS